MYVLPSTRRPGFVNALFSSALAEVSALSGLRQLQLRVGVHNAATRSLYESFGFEQVGLRPQALRVEGQLCDEELFVCRLAIGVPTLAVLRGAPTSARRRAARRVLISPFLYYAQLTFVLRREYGRAEGFGATQDVLDPWFADFHLPVQHWTVTKADRLPGLPSEHMPGRLGLLLAVDAQYKL